MDYFDFLKIWIIVVLNIFCYRSIYFLISTNIGDIKTILNKLYEVILLTKNLTYKTNLIVFI